MAILKKEAAAVLAPALLTCGWEAEWVETIQQVAGSDLTLASLGTLPEAAQKSLAKLLAEAIQGDIIPFSVLARFGRPKHFREMNEQAVAGTPTVAYEIPQEFRAVAHTLLPVTSEGVYANEGRIVTLKGLVPLGPQEGNLVAHLSGVFSSGCSKKEIEELLHAQACDAEFMKAADRVGTIDYTDTKLRAVTELARKAANL